MLNDRENILSALREKPLKIYQVMKRVNLANEEACQTLLLKMRDEGLVKFDISQGPVADRVNGETADEHRARFNSTPRCNGRTLTQCLMCIPPMVFRLAR